MLKELWGGIPVGGLLELHSPTSLFGAGLLLAELFYAS